MMRKTVVYIVAIALMSFVYSCGAKNNGDATSQDCDTLGKDSVVVPVLPDLSAFELKGPVKSVAFNDNYYEKVTCEFSNNGKLLKAGDCIVERDKKGRIKVVQFPSAEGGDTGMSATLIYSYDKQGRVKSIAENSDGWHSDAVFRYNGQGFVEVDTTKNIYGTYVITYQYDNVDRHGNWTSRKFTERMLNDDGEAVAGEETRVITYY